MKCFVFVIAFVAVVQATSSPAGYNYPIPEVVDNYRTSNQNSFTRNTNTFSFANDNFGINGQTNHLYQTSGGGTVQKHIYVHVAPPEPEEFRQVQQFPVQEAQKHYKIIFIKAPSYSAPVAPIIPQTPQNEEKTLVYVLVKKPEEQADITIPTAAPTQPSKPEVHFIRYKTEKDQTSTRSTSTSTSTHITGYTGITRGQTGNVYGPPELIQN